MFVIISRAFFKIIILKILKKIEKGGIIKTIKKEAREKI